MAPHEKSAAQYLLSDLDPLPYPRRVRLLDTEPAGEAAALLAVARHLAGDGGHASGLFAVAAVESCGERDGWAAPWRNQLASLRGHAVPDVRDAALSVCTSYE